MMSDLKKIQNAAEKGLVVIYARDGSLRLGYVRGLECKSSSLNFITVAIADYIDHSKHEIYGTENIILPEYTDEWVQDRKKFK